MYLSCSMLLILLSLLCNHDDLILRLYQKKRYHDEGWIFIDRFKVEGDQVIKNKEVLD